MPTTYRKHVTAIEAGSANISTYALACIIDLTAQMLEAFIQQEGLADNSVDITRASFSQKIGVLHASGEERLIALAESFRFHKNAIPPLSATQDDILELLADARAIMRHLDCAEQPAKLRVAAQTRTVNAVSVETLRGYKTFHLMQGDVTVVPADLLVISTHGNPTLVPDGMLVRTLRQNYRIEVDPSREWLRFDKRVWTCFQEIKRPKHVPFSHLLTLRIPQSPKDLPPAEFFDRAVRGVYASISALEGMGYSFPVIAMPVLSGQRIVDYRAAVESLIRHAVAWLKKSEYTHTVEFVVFSEEELHQWDQAMNSCLGRTLISTGHNEVLGSLCREVTHHAKPHVGGPLDGAIRPLLEALAQQENLGIENICIFGRKLAEIMLRILLPRLGLNCGPNLMQNIEALRQSSRAAPWIVSYMHSLRIFGNEMVHERSGEIGYCPSSLGPGDLVSALSAIRSLLAFWDEIEKEFSNA